jgi:hypothetical protein
MFWQSFEARGYLPFGQNRLAKQQPGFDIHNSGHEALRKTAMGLVDV